MSIIDTLIFDRTIEQVLRIGELASISHTRELTAEELDEWNAAVVRGTYNVEDINRVGAAAIFVNDYLSSVQPSIDAHRIALGVADDAIFDAHIASAAMEISPRTDWARDASPIMREDAHKTLQAAIITAERVGITLTADVSRMTYTAANAVERALYDAYRYGETAEITRKDKADRIAGGWYFSGDLVCGDITT